MKNEYRIDGDKLIIYMKRKDGTIIETFTDANMLDKLMQLDVSWSAKLNHTNRKFYAQTTHYTVGEDGKKKGKNRYLHKYLFDAETDTVVDHINTDSLDNRISNLRIVTSGENNLNRSGANRNNAAGIRNVMIDRKYNKYKVVLWLDGKHKNFGSFEEEDLDLAAGLAELARQKYYGL